MILGKMHNYELEALLPVTNYDTKKELSILKNAYERWNNFIRKNMKTEFVEEIDRMINDEKLLHLQAAIYPLSQLENKDLEPLVDEIENSITIIDKP
jgi:hypothetical protein